MNNVIAIPSASASEKQIAFLTKLINERDGRLDATKQEVLDSVREALPTGCFTKQTASALIDMFLSVDWKPARNDAPVAPMHNDIDAPPVIAPGTYTVVLDVNEEHYVTVRIAPGKWADGKLVASFLSGSDNENSYTGFAFVTGKGVNLWKRFIDNKRLAAAIAVLLNDTDAAHEMFLNLAEAYAMKSGQCMRCHRKLTVPASLHRGLGPECANKEGV